MRQEIVFAIGIGGTREPGSFVDCQSFPVQSIALWTLVIFMLGALT